MHEAFFIQDPYYQTDMVGQDTFSYHVLHVYLIEICHYFLHWSFNIKDVLLINFSSELNKLGVTLFSES